MKPAPPFVVMPFLQGIDYPASREHIVRVAIRQAVPEEVLRTLQSLTERTFNSEDALQAAVERRAAGATAAGADRAISLAPTA